MSDHGSASDGSDYPTSSEFSKEDNARFRQAKGLLRQEAKDLFNTLSLVRCDEVSQRMLESCGDQISQLHESYLVYFNAHEEAIYVVHEARRWNWDQLVSNLEDYQVAFDRACAYYQREILDRAANPQQRIDCLEYVHELAELYDDAPDAKELKVNERFGELLKTCAELSEESSMVGRAEFLARIAAKVRKELKDKRPQ